MIVYSPLERGLLTGKFTGKPSFAKGDHRAEKEIFSPKFLTLIDQAMEPIRAIHRTIAQPLPKSSLSTFHQKGITPTLVGARNASQAKENGLTLKLKLSDEERQTVVAALSDPSSSAPFTIDNPSSIFTLLTHL